MIIVTDIKHARNVEMNTTSDNKKEENIALPLAFHGAEPPAAVVAGALGPGAEIESGEDQNTPLRPVFEPEKTIPACLPHEWSERSRI